MCYAFVPNMVKLLWSRLRDRRMNGLKFRRQHPFGPYVLDFFCASSNLGVEVDGSGHLDREPRDEARARWLGEHGVRVLRFWNNEVRDSLDAVVEEIAVAAATPLTPNPSPRCAGRGE